MTDDFSIPNAHPCRNPASTVDGNVLSSENKTQLQRVGYRASPYGQQRGFRRCRGRDRRRVPANPRWKARGHLSRQLTSSGWCATAALGDRFLNTFKPLGA